MVAEVVVEPFCAVPGGERGPKRGPEVESNPKQASTKPPESGENDRTAGARTRVYRTPRRSSTARAAAPEGSDGRPTADFRFFLDSGGFVVVVDAVCARSYARSAETETETRRRDDALSASTIVAGSLALRFEFEFVLVINNPLVLGALSPQLDTSVSMTDATARSARVVVAEMSSGGTDSASPSSTGNMSARASNASRAAETVGAVGMPPIIPEESRQLAYIIGLSSIKPIREATEEKGQQWDSVCGRRLERIQPKARGSDARDESVRE